MRYIAMTIPDDETELRQWLEDAIVRGEAGELAEQLSAARGRAIDASPATLPADIAAGVRKAGLAGLNNAQVGLLMKHPRMLVALAEDVYAHGASFWSRRLAQEHTYDSRVSDGWQRLQNELFPAKPAPAPRASKRSFSPVPWLAAFATAAAVLVAVFAIPELRNAILPAQQQQQVAKGWGWQKANELAPDAKPAEYLEAIASLADEWKAQDTSTATALAERITEVRQGCAKLQLMQHTPLTEPQREELLARCKKWASKFDQSLATLEATGNVEQVRSEMTATMEQVSAALRADAAKIRAG